MPVTALVTRGKGRKAEERDRDVPSWQQEGKSETCISG